MDPVNPLNGLAELLRKRIASETSVREGRSAGRRQNTEKSGEGGRLDVATLRTRLTDAIRAIDPDDQSRNKKLLRTFVEGVLAWQFGNELLNDPRFNDLVEDVQRALESDPSVIKLLEEVICRG